MKLDKFVLFTLAIIIISSCSSRLNFDCYPCELTSFGRASGENYLTKRDFNIKVSCLNNPINLTKKDSIVLFYSLHTESNLDSMYIAYKGVFKESFECAFRQQDTSILIRYYLMLKKDGNCYFQSKCSKSITLNSANEERELELVFFNHEDGSIDYVIVNDLLDNKYFSY